MTGPTSDGLEDLEWVRGDWICCCSLNGFVDGLQSLRQLRFCSLGRTGAV